MSEKEYSLEEIEFLAEKKYEGKIIKKLKINSDSKNLFVRIPKDIEEHLKLERGDTIRFEVDKTIPIKEAIITCKPIKK